MGGKIDDFVEGLLYVKPDNGNLQISQNGAKTGKNISRNLPHGGIGSVIREHPRNPDLLFAGTERGAFFRLTGQFPCDRRSMEYLIYNIQ